MKNRIVAVELGSAWTDKSARKTGIGSLTGRYQLHILHSLFPEVSQYTVVTKTAYPNVVHMDTYLGGIEKNKIPRPHADSMVIYCRDSSNTAEEGCLLDNSQNHNGQVNCGCHIFQFEVTSDS